ncbi:chemotaxis protein CheW [Thiomicrorhabdus sp.]|uniref:chemotaxis protein CheW n=1 Tax=Thiomicrorhabdus sp. TaxID=2039724 RepID=UPI0035620B2D
MSLLKHFIPSEPDQFSFFDDDIFHPQFLIFEDRNRFFALDANAVEEVLVIDQITPLPGLNNELIGTTAVRGVTLYTLPIDLLLDSTSDKKQQTAHDSNSLIIIREQTDQDLPRVGILVERIWQLHAIKANSIQTVNAEEKSQHIGNEFLGRVSLHKQNIYILNHEQLFRKDNLMTVICDSTTFKKRDFLS